MSESLVSLKDSNYYSNGGAILINMNKHCTTNIIMMMPISNSSNNENSAQDSTMNDERK